MSSNLWGTSKVADIIISSNTGLDAIKSAPIVNYDTGVKCIRIQDISQKKDFSKWGFCEVEERNFEKFKLRRDDILVARTGASIGVNKIIDENMRAVFNNGLIRLRADAKKVDSRFLFYNMQSEKYKSHIHSISGGTSTQPNMKMNALLDFEIMLPPLSVQRSISYILKTLDDKINLNNIINQRLEELAQTIFKSWFLDFEKNNNEEYMRFSDWLIPESYYRGRADDFFDISIGKTPPRKEPEWFSSSSKDIKWLSIADMGYSGVYIQETSEYLTADAIKKYNVQKVPPNTVMLSFKLTIGRISISDYEMVTNEAIAHFKSKNPYLVEYIYLFLKNYNYSKLGSTSSIATATNSKVIKSMPIYIPNEDLLKSFHDAVSPLFAKIKTNQKQNIVLCELRDSLLIKLMSGEIRTPLEEGLYEEIC